MCQPIPMRGFVEQFPPNELIHEPVMVSATEEFLVGFEIGLDDVLQHQEVFRRVVGRVREENAQDSCRLAQSISIAKTTLLLGINRQKELVRRARENLRTVMDLVARVG